MNKRAVIGIALVGLGLLFLLQSLDIIWFGFWEIIWRLLPFALIAFGAHLIIKRMRKADFDSGKLRADFTVHPDRPTYGQSVAGMPPAYEGSSAAERQSTSEEQSATERQSTSERQSAADRSSREGSGTHREARASSAQASSEDGKIRFTQMFGDLFVDCEGLSLKSVEISGFIGDIEVTINGGKLQPGLNRIIISDFIGDIKIFVPKGMPTFVHCSNFIGDIDIFGKRTSGFGNHIESQTADYTAASDKLFLAISSFISDVRIYAI